MDLHSHTESYFFLPLGDLKKTKLMLLFSKVIFYVLYYLLSFVETIILMSVD